MQMKLQFSVAAQIVFLLLASIAGFVLSEDLVDGPRTAHRLSGVLAGLVGLVVVVQAIMQRHSPKQIILAASVFLLTIVAAIAGNALATADDYDATYNVMRSAGAIALILAVILFVFSRREASNPKPAATSDTEETGE